MNFIQRQTVTKIKSLGEQDYFTFCIITEDLNYLYI